MEFIVSAVALGAMLILVARQVPGSRLPAIVGVTLVMILIVIGLERMMTAAP